MRIEYKTNIGISIFDYDTVFIVAYWFNSRKLKTDLIQIVHLKNYV